MEWLAPTLSILFGMLCCTGIITIDLKAIRRLLEARKQPGDESAKGRTYERGDG